jgi:hypothetical protein
MVLVEHWVLILAVRFLEMVAPAVQEGPMVPLLVADFWVVVNMAVVVVVAILIVIMGVELVRAVQQ